MAARVTAPRKAFSVDAQCKVSPVLDGSEGVSDSMLLLVKVFIELVLLLLKATAGNTGLIPGASK